jgi:hypothetical protein
VTAWVKASPASTRPRRPQFPHSRRYRSGRKEKYDKDNEYKHRIYVVVDAFEKRRAVIDHRYSHHRSNSRKDGHRGIRSESIRGSYRVEQANKR